MQNDIKFFDCFTFSTELDLLKLRLEELKDVVDYFVIVESNKTFSNKPKPLYFEKNKKLFSKYQDKIIHITVRDMPKNPKDAWEMEYFQRNAILRGLKNAEKDDYIIISDIDEIPKAEAIKNFQGNIGVLEQDLFYYKFNCQCITMKWYRSVIMRKNLLTTPQEARNWAIDQNYKNSEIIADAGWHFSYLGSEQDIKNKIETFAHQEYNKDEYKDIQKIKESIAQGKDLFGRKDVSFEFMDIDDTFPAYLLKNLPRYSKFIANISDSERKTRIIRKLEDEIKVYQEEIKQKEEIRKDLKVRLIDQKKTIKDQDRQLLGLGHHLNRLYNHPSYIIKHWIKQVIKKILPSFTLDNPKSILIGDIRQKKSKLFYKTLTLKEPEKPTVSIIIPVFNKWEYTYDCLRSIQAKCKDVEYEVIVVDNASTDKTNQLIKKIENVRYLRNEKNVGFGDACNQGMKKAKGEYLVFLNNDTVVSENWLTALLKTFKDNSNIGMVGSKLVYPDGRLQEAGGIVWQNKSACNYGNMSNPEAYEFNYLKDVDYCSGASVMLRADILKRLKGFDDIFAPAYYEDTDLAFRIRKLGLRTVYQPLSVLTHFEGVTAGKDTTKGLKKYQEVNQKKFFARWADTLKKENGKNMNDIFLARDRSMGKKVLLYVDYRIPEYDKDAGAFITYEYLKVLQDMGYKVIFWPHDQVKLEPYTTRLQQMGIEVVYGGIDFEDFILENGKHIDITILSRPTVAEAFADIILDYTDSKVMYIAHDLHHLREARGAEINGSKKAKTLAIKTKKLELEAMQKADISLFFSDKEVEIIKDEDLGIRADVMPWIQEIEASKTETPPFAKRNGLLFLGGFNHPPNVDSVQWFHDKILPLVQKDIKDIEVFIAGSKPSDKILALDKGSFKVLGFVEEDKIEGLFHKAKIFIAPLRYGAGFKGKVAKAMSFGLPVVTTDVGSEGIGLIDNENAMIANNEKEFAEKIVKLYKDEKTWKKISENSVQHVREKYSPENAEKEIKRIIAEI